MDVAILSRAWWWLGALLGALVGFELLRHWIGKSVRSLRHRWIARRALRGEAHAEDLLIRAGYQIVGRQVEHSYLVRVDGLSTKVVVIADLLVRSPDGQILVAEVKTGREAPRVKNSATRRQLLEYRVAFDAPGVLIVNADTDAISEVRFPIDPQRTPRSTSRWVHALAAGVAIGFTAALVLAPWLPG